MIEASLGKLPPQSPPPHVLEKDLPASPIKRVQAIALFVTVLIGLLVMAGSVATGIIFNIMAIYFLTGLALASVIVAAFGLYKMATKSPSLIISTTPPSFETPRE